MNTSPLPQSDHLDHLIIANALQHSIPSEAPSAVKFWAIADTHLSFGKHKDMAKFGETWQNHEEKIRSHWLSLVAAQDVVLIPGDISWAQSQNRVLPDLEWLQALPGRKVLLRGNHDHWWKKIDIVRQLVEPMGFYAIQGDCIELDGVLIAGAMGYIAEGDPYWENDQRKDRFEREFNTLSAALNDAGAKRADGQALIVMTHYPPFTSDGKPTPFAELITTYQPTLCLYGHLHRSSEWDVAQNGIYQGVKYQLVASDFVKMTPQLVWEVHN